MKKPSIKFINFFENNTPKFWQILGDIGLTAASISATILMLPEIAHQSGFENFQLPVLLVSINKWCLVTGAIIKFLTKFAGKKDV